MARRGKARQGKMRKFGQRAAAVRTIGGKATLACCIQHVSAAILHHPDGVVDRNGAQHLNRARFGIDGHRTDSDPQFVGVVSDVGETLHFE